MSDMMIIPLRVPRELGRQWKMEAVKQDKSVQKWILEQIQRTILVSKPSPVERKQPVVKSQSIGGVEGHVDSFVGGEPLMEVCDKCGERYAITFLFKHPKHPGKYFCEDCVDNQRNGQ